MCPNMERELTLVQDSKLRWYFHSTSVDISFWSIMTNIKQPTDYYIWENPQTNTSTSPIITTTCLKDAQRALGCCLICSRSSTQGNHSTNTKPIFTEWRHTSRTCWVVSLQEKPEWHTQSYTSLKNPTQASRGPLLPHTILFQNAY